MLPTFKGLENEDPHKNLKEFHVVCCTMRHQRVTKEHIKLRAFPFSLGLKSGCIICHLVPLPHGMIWQGYFWTNLFLHQRPHKSEKRLVGLDKEM